MASSSISLDCFIHYPRALQLTNGIFDFDGRKEKERLITKNDKRTLCAWGATITKKWVFLRIKSWGEI